uniref:histidinol-phosphatase n=1 Tax=Arcella intermedia TaxID=1963864 RepID=A0A6B2LCR5_9EUKA
MLFSFHSHSGSYCNHAQGTLREVIQKAISKGFTHLGLTEHMPRYNAKHLYPEEAHLSIQNLEDLYDNFVVEAKQLQVEYWDKIKLFIGLETEWIDEDYERRIKQLIEKHSLDYVVGSCHHVKEFPFDFSADPYNDAVKDLGSLENMYLSYFDAQYELLKSVKPLVVGHFDLIRIYSKDFEITPSVWVKIKRNVDFVISYGGIFELNSRAWKKGINGTYPGADVIKYILACDGKFTLSDDSHGPADVGMFYEKLPTFLQDNNITTLWYLDRDHLQQPIQLKSLHLSQLNLK